MANTIDFHINNWPATLADPLTKLVNWIPKVSDRVPKAPNYQHSIMCDSLLGDASIGDDSRTKGYYESPTRGDQGKKNEVETSLHCPLRTGSFATRFRGAAETKVQLVPPMGHSTFLIYIIPDN